MTATLDGATTAAHASKAAVTLSGVTKAFGAGNRRVLAIDGIDLEVPIGSFTCIVGASGCGKSTLLSLVAGLEQPTSGALSVEGKTALMFLSLIHI